MRAPYQAVTAVISALARVLRGRRRRLFMWHHMRVVSIQLSGFQQKVRTDPPRRWVTREDAPRALGGVQEP